jgi:hypothetical protein
MKRHPLLLIVAGVLFLQSSSAYAQEVSVRPEIGGFPAAAGFALGGVVSRTHSPGPVEIRAEGLVSIKKYQLYEVGAAVPELGRWLSFDVAARYRNFPQENFWGLGPNSPESARSNYRLEGVDTVATLAASTGRFRAGVNGGFLKFNMGPGIDEDLPSIPESLQTQPRLKHIGGFLEYETLDEESDPHSGGKYAFEWTSYMSSFQTYVIDVRRFIPVTATDRIGLRMQTTFTHSSPAEDVPFFLYPFIGGSDTVRGMSHYRFRDRNALVLNAEYRRPLAGFLDLVVFADAGRVFTKSTDLGFRNLHPAAGAGVRVKFGRNVFFGIDFGFSGERAKVSFRSDHLF